jgi:inner membrane protein
MKIEITNHGKWHQSLTLKLALLAFMGIVFMIPLEMIKSIINERMNNADKVKMEISNQWAARQTVSGPVLNIPVRSIPAGKDEKPVITIWHLLPETLNITGKIDPEIRYRGIYQSVVYSSPLAMKGEFILPEKNNLTIGEILWKEAYYTIGISDNRGLKGEVMLKTSREALQAEPGVRDQNIFTSGISFPDPLSDSVKRIPFSIEMNLSGSESLFLTPLGKSTTAELESSWSSPSFTGSFLPASRTVDEKGFRAKWLVTHLNRNYPQSWMGNSFGISESTFGLDLFLPVDHYQKSYRSARYGILFIALTFLVLIFLEITRKENIHIFHYFLVSLGLVLFFSLLNSLSEQTGFNIAYLIASTATIMLITLFTSSLFRNKKTSFVVFGMLVILYGFIYVLLTLNDYAYLAGNIGLFILLASVMSLAAKMKIFKGEGENFAGTDPS